MKAGKPHTLKTGNRKAILSLMRETGDMTIPDLAGTLNLSKMTIGKIIEYFVGLGIIESAGKGDSTSEGGKKPEKYRLNPRYAHAIGVHLYPGHATAALYDLRGELILEKTVNFDEIPSLVAGQTVKTEILESVKDEAEKLYGLCGELIGEAGKNGDGVIGIGVAVPGVCDSEKGRVIYSPWFPGWDIDMPLARMLTDALGSDIPIMVDNEFRFYVLAEKRLRGISDDCTFIVMGVVRGGGGGLGSGILHYGNVLRGPHCLAGEIGHMVVNPGGDPCSCGGRGCFEAMVHKNRVRRLIGEGRDSHRDSLLFASKGPGDVTLPDIFGAVSEGDAFAREILDDIIGWFAIAISNIMVCFDPDMVILYGIYSQAGEYFISDLRRRVSEITLPSVRKAVVIEYSNLGDENGTRGAALCMIDSYFQTRW